MPQDEASLQVDFGIVVTAASALLALSALVYLLDRRQDADRAPRSGAKALLWAHLWYVMASIGLEAGALLPVPVSVAMVVAGAFWGMIAGYLACIAALTRAPTGAAWLWIALGGVAAQALLLVASGDLMAVFVSSSLLNGTLALYFAWRLRRAATVAGFAGDWVLLLPFLAIAAAYLARLGMVLAGAPAGSVVVASLAIGLVFPIAALFWVFAAMSLRSFHLNRELDRTANNDALTGLGNRMSFERFTAALPAQERRRARRIACFAIDMDRFKEINDSYGHAAGDAVLVATAERLRARATAQGDRIFRIGGDEFVLWHELPEDDATGTPAEAASFAQDLVAQLCRPVGYHGVDLIVGASVGYEIADAGIAPAEVVRRADTALYCSKEAGRNRVTRYTARHGDARSRQLSALQSFRLALETDRISAHFQPQIDLRSGRVAGCEVLARWSTARDERIEPAVFLALAEELDMLAELDRQILDRAISAFHGWRSAGVALPKISVNVSVSRLRDGALIDELARRDDLPAGVLSFELLETALAEEDETMRWNIDRLREMGVGIEIDNFGTGHAAMSAVLALRPDRIKIDRLFVRRIADDPQRRAMLRTLVELVLRAEARSVIEGVETDAQRRLTAELGADEAQGFAIAEPMPRDEMERWLRGTVAQAS